MLPYIGKNYGKDGQPKILLIAESNYLPEDSIINNDAETWYKSTQADLTSKEISWINCRNLKDHVSNGRSIQGILNKSLSKHFKNSDEDAFTNIAYMNGYQRPAPKTGSTIGNELNEMDNEIGSQVISDVVSAIKPDIVIFVSKLAWKNLKRKLENRNEDILLEYTCHPSTGGLGWYKKDSEGGEIKFNKILSQFKYS